MSFGRCAGTNVTREVQFAPINGGQSAVALRISAGLPGAKDHRFVETLVADLLEAEPLHIGSVEVIAQALIILCEPGGVVNLGVDFGHAARGPVFPDRRDEVLSYLSGEMELASAPAHEMACMAQPPPCLPRHV